MSATPASPQREFAREELSKELLHDYSTSSATTAETLTPE